jgi:glycosyltransferase involved in cell wall biosynthesis
MSKPKKFVVAFRGRRDSYMVPIALEKAGALEALITDLYIGNRLSNWLKRLPFKSTQKLSKRNSLDLPKQKVLAKWPLASLEFILRAFGLAPSNIYRLFDPLYGASALRVAENTGANLLLYSSYAHPALKRAAQTGLKKIVFQYHPHFVFESKILSDDRDWAASQGIVFSNRFENLAETGDSFRQESDAAFQYADRIICASSFSKRSLVAAGACESLISVVPYGIELPATRPLKYSPRRGFQALFVGSGFQRKGLHHLLLAWQHARLPNDCRLTVVSRTIDPAIEPLLRHVCEVKVLRGVTQFELEALYRESDLFVMPSLVEGFGQVYLEALSHGLPVLGTENTCLPDIGTELDGVYITPSADVGALVDKLESLSRELPDQPERRLKAYAKARQFTWQKFYKDLLFELDR